MRLKREKSAFGFTENSLCPYFDDGRIAAVGFLFPDAKDIENFHEFLSRGYRRLGSFLYRTVCKGCSAADQSALRSSAFNSAKARRGHPRRTMTCG